MKRLALTITFLLLLPAESFAEDPKKETREPTPEKSYYRVSKGYSSNPEPDPPLYVNQLNKTGIAAFKDINWIDAGLAYRARLEYRDNDFRRPADRVDQPILSRTQAYFGIKNILDPLRFAVELQDSRRFHSQFPKSTGETNELDVFQAYAELYFKKPLDRPIRLRAGRMAFEVLDRKLISRDDWGNTGTNFQGFRATIGKKENDWQIDSFALEPMIKEMTAQDQTNKNQWVYGGILNWRRWSEITTIQPFYLELDQKKSPTSTARKINSPGMRIYGDFAGSRFDYDLIGIYQFGESDDKKHLAKAYSAELGYTHNHNWKPRFSLIYGYASGDKDPSDNKNQRFEKFYGFNRPWSNSNTIEWENLKTVKSRFELAPNKNLRLEGSCSYYWLASSSDIWKRGNLQDKTGASGDFIGQDYDLRARYQVTKNFATTFGYAHFKPGEFTKTVGRNGSSDFLYLELSLSLFGWRPVAPAVSNLEDTDF